MLRNLITFAALINSALFFGSAGAQAAKFANQFSEFELPPAWQCNLEGAEWVCQSSIEAKKREAIIVLAAKLKGDQDSLDQYLDYLKKPKMFKSVQGKPMKSEVRYAKNVTLNGQPWIDSLHLESEIPDYYTRYIATIKEDIGVLITYSINKTKYQDYLNDFENMVRTLKVFRKKGGINAAPANTNLFDATKVPTGLTADSVFAPNTTSEEGAGGAKKPGAEDKNGLPLMLGLGAAAVGVFVFLKRRKGGAE